MQNIKSLPFRDYNIPNTRLLSYASPATPSLNTLAFNAYLLMPADDLHRYSFYNNVPAKSSTKNNETSDEFNHFLSSKGGAWTESLINGNFITPVAKGGILPLVKHEEIKAGNFNSNAPVPVPQSFAEFPVNQKVSAFVDKPIPLQVNPIALPEKQIHNHNYIKLLSPNQLIK